MPGKLPALGVGGWQGAPLQERYQKLAKVGEGSCGVVFKCRDRESNRIVAVKKVRFTYETEVDLAGSGAAGVFGVPAPALREVAMLSALQGHPNVVQLLDAFLDGARVFLVTEFLERDLRRHLDEQGPLHPRRVKLYAWQLLRALAHCHAHCIAHRDVKPQNVLVDPETDTLKLCDFSLARRLLPGPDLQTRRVASLWYRSPELLLGGEASGVPLDVWSCGCVLGELLLQRPLFPGSSEIETLFFHFRLLGRPTARTWPGAAALPHWSDKFPDFEVPRGGLVGVARGDAPAASVLSSMLRCNPTSRSSASAILNDTYFLDLDLTGHATEFSIVVDAGHDKHDGAAN